MIVSTQFISSLVYFYFFRLTTVKNKPLKHLVDGYVNFALCQSQFSPLIFDWIRDPSFYIYYIYIYQNPWKMFISFAVHSPPSAFGVIYYFFVSLSNFLSPACLCCALSPLMIHVKQDKRHSEVSNRFDTDSLSFFVLFFKNRVFIS